MRRNEEGGRVDRVLRRISVLRQGNGDGKKRRRGRENAAIEEYAGFNL